MSIRTADLLIATIRNGDATSQHTFDLARLLGSDQVQVQILINEPVGPLPAAMRAITRQVNPIEYTPASDLTILQYPIWFPLAERLRWATGARIFWYHGVTPPGLWGVGADQALLYSSENNTTLSWHAHVAVTASPFTAAELHRHSGYPPERIRVIPLSVDVAAFQRKPSASQLAALRAHWHLEGKRVLLYVGRIAGHKRIDLLIDAVARLADQHPDLHLLIVGDASVTLGSRQVNDQLRQQAASLGVADRVTFTGKVEDVQSFYHLADLYVLASQHEGFGAPLVEAMAAEVPIVASASGAIPWVLNDETTDSNAAGLLFAPDQVDDLVRQITRILSEPELRHTLVEHGRQRAQAFTPQQFDQRVRGVLAEVTELAKEPPPIGQRPYTPLYDYADTSLRAYRVRSNVPLLGRLIEWVRVNSTSHLKEAYLDRLVEQQVSYNRMLAAEINRLQDDIARLQLQVNELRQGKDGKLEN